MLRTIAIALILVLSLSVMLPFSNSAHGVRQSVQVTKKRHYRYRSRAWWRRYRARLRQRREAAAALAAHRKALMALPANIPVGDLSAVGGPSVPVLPESSPGVSTLPAPPAYASAQPQPVTTTAMTTATVQPVTVTATAQPVALSTDSQPVSVSPNVQSAHVSNGQTRPRVVGNLRAAVKSPAAKLPGQMSLSVVALSRPNPVFLTAREQKNMLAGLPVADLRRIVIDKMVSAGGWVTNDFIREVNGKRMFVVMARTPGDTLTPERAWTFYFTEAGGRIYGLTTDAPLEFADRMSNEAERYIETLRAKAEPISNK
ncbi:MAG TPA: hypothetical protein VFY34_09780 [Pyrinomonadaceae bacterium]|nr:hypothetical protein [Pyrinomonadaceae bacterium]